MHEVIHQYEQQRTSGVWSSSADALASVSATGIVKTLCNRRTMYFPRMVQRLPSVKTVAVTTIANHRRHTRHITPGSMTLVYATPFGGAWNSSNRSAVTVHPTTVFVKGYWKLSNILCHQP